MSDDALVCFERLFGPEFGHGKPLGLASLRAALPALGDPHDRLPPVIHIAGTNGKGSTVAFMRAIAEAAGLRVHAFTKPHLFRLNERFVVARSTIDDARLIAAAERVHAAAPALTQFDAQVAAAALLFSETPADIALIETGMGGRDDSTNIVTPALAAIAPIGLDHQDALGPTLAEIAAHKAGILKPGVAAFIVRQPDAARAVVEARAGQIGAPLYRQGSEWDAHASAGRLLVQTPTRALDLPLPALHGAHQIDNAGLAVATLQHWRELDDAAFATGVANARIAARLQPLTRGPLSAPIRALGGEVWVDAGHNGHAAAALARAINDMKAKRGGTNIAVVGLRARKQAEAFFDTLNEGIDAIVAVPLAEPHIPPQRLLRHARDYGLEAEAARSLAEAVQKAAQFPAPRVLICGSFLLAAEALALENV